MIKLADRDTPAAQWTNTHTFPPFIISVHNLCSEIMKVPDHNFYKVLIKYHPTSYLIYFNSSKHILEISTTTLIIVLMSKYLTS